MDLKGLSYFITLSEKQSFTRAAQALYIAQPALSRKILELEREIGVALIDREARPIRLTHAGRTMEKYARLVLADVRLLEEQMRLERSGQGELLTVGYGMAGHVPHLAAAVSRLRGTNSTMEIRLARLFNCAVLDQILSGRLDAGTVNLPEPLGDDRLNAVSVFACGLVAFVTPGHRLSGRAGILLKDLKRERLMLFARDTSPRQYDAILALFGDVRPNICAHAADTTAFSLLLQLEDCVGIMPATTSVLSPNIASAIPITDTHGFDLALVWRKNEENPAIPLLLSALKTARVSL